MSQVPDQPRGTALVKQFGDKVGELATHYVTQLLQGERAKEASARVGLAFRTAALKNPQLYTVKQDEIARAVALCALTGLMPSGPTPEVELIPRWHKVRVLGDDGQIFETKKLAVDWQVTSRGWTKLARQSGWDVFATPVFDGEKFSAPHGISPDGIMFGPIEHEPDYDTPWSWDRLRLFYVIAYRPDRTQPPRWKIVPKHKIAELRRRAETDNVWKSDPIEMSEKASKAYALRRNLVPLGESGEIASEPEEALASFVAEDDGSAPPAPPASPPALTVWTGAAEAAAKNGPAAVRAALGSAAPSTSQPPVSNGTTPQVEGGAKAKSEPKPDPDAEERARLMAAIQEWEDQLANEDRIRIRREVQVQRINAATPIDRLRKLLGAYRATQPDKASTTAAPTPPPPEAQPEVDEPEVDDLPPEPDIPADPWVSIAEQIVDAEAVILERCPDDGEARIEEAALAAGLPFSRQAVAAVTDGAPEEALVRYRDALIERTPV